MVQQEDDATVMRSHDVKPEILSTNPESKFKEMKLNVSGKSNMVQMDGW